MASRDFQIPSIEDTMLQGAESVIDESVIALNHPSGTTVNNVIYANPRNSSLDLTKLQMRCGVYRIPPTSLGIASSVSWTVLNRSMITGLYISGKITIPAYTGLISNWFYYLINTLMVSISGINNLQYTGISLRDMYMLEAPKARRDFLTSDLLPICDNTTTGTPTQFDFIVPLPLFFNEGLIATKGFVFDANTLNTPMNININFNPLSQVTFAATGHTGPTLPTTFDQLYIKTYAQMDHLTQQFAAHKVSNSLKVPFNFVQYYSLPNQTCITGGVENTLQLQQLPQGELLRIVLSASDASKMGDPNTVKYDMDFDPVKFKYLRLTLNGNDMIFLESEKEIYNQQLYNSIGDDAAIQYRSDVFTNATGTPGSSTKYMTTLDCFVPAIAGSMYESEFSVAESFNGQIFQLSYKLVDTTISLLNWNITYLANGIINVENGEAKLQT